MVPTHATKAGIRYRYYVSLPCLHGEASTAKVGSVTRVPAPDIEDVVVKSLNEHLTSQNGIAGSATTGHGAIAELIERIDVHKDRLAVRLRSRDNPGTIDLTDSNDRRAITSYPFPGRSRRPKGSDKSCCLKAHREKTSVLSGRNDASVWSAPSLEAGAGWMR
jgi:site-specific DNA recombinase